MKKSSSITLGLLAAVAMAVTTGCRRTEVRDCVDQNNRIVDEKFCKGQQPQQQQSTSHGGGFVPYYWMYGGSSGGRIGDTVIGGRNTPTPGMRAVTRGGFGHSFGRIGG